MATEANTPTSIETDNLGSLTLHTANFITSAINIGGVDDATWSSSLQAIVGYWFNRTAATVGAASLLGVDVSLVSGTEGQFRFHTSDSAVPGKFYVLTLS